MVAPHFTVRDFRAEVSAEVTGPGDEELLRNYEFNISQGIIQRVSRFFDALALMDVHGEAPPAAASRGRVMGFGLKRSIGNQEASAHTVAWEQAKKVTNLEAKIAKLEALAALSQKAPTERQKAPIGARLGEWVGWGNVRVDR